MQVVPCQMLFVKIHSSAVSQIELALLLGCRDEPMGLQARCPVCCCTLSHLLAMFSGMQIARCAIADRMTCLQTHWLILKLHKQWGDLPQDMSVLQTGVLLMIGNLLQYVGYTATTLSTEGFTDIIGTS